VVTEDGEDVAPLEVVEALAEDGPALELPVDAAEVTVEFPKLDTDAVELLDELAADDAAEEVED